MEDMDILSQMIKATALAPTEVEYNKLNVRLLEPQAPDSSVTIKNLPTDAIVIKVDNFHSPDNIFNGNNGECKRADYVIISAQKKCILYIEIKRTRGDRKKVVKQLIGARCFVRYCQEIGKSFWNKRDFLADYQDRFISIGHTNIAKRKTRISKTAPKHDSPENAMKVDWPNYLQFHQLASLGI